MGLSRCWYPVCRIHRVWLCDMKVTEICLWTSAGKWHGFTLFLTVPLTPHCPFTPPAHHGPFITTVPWLALFVFFPSFAFPPPPSQHGWPFWWPSSRFQCPCIWKHPQCHHWSRRWRSCTGCLQLGKPTSNIKTTDGSRTTKSHVLHRQIGFPPYQTSTTSFPFSFSSFIFLISLPFLTLLFFSTQASFSSSSSSNKSSSSLLQSLLGLSIFSFFPLLFFITFEVPVPGAPPASSSELWSSGIVWPSLRHRCSVNG